MKRAIICIGILAVLLPAVNVAGNEPYPPEDLPVLKNVGIESNVKYDEAARLYSYSYAVANPASNTGQISMVEVDISKPADTKELRSDGLIITIGARANGKTISRSFDSEISKMSASMDTEVVPVGVAPPYEWSAGISTMGTVLWGSGSAEYRIMPGSSQQGYRIESYGIPAIRNVTMHPKWLLTVDDVSEEEVEMSRRIKKEIAFYTKTIGPTAPPKDLNYQDFLDSIISMKHEAYALGWITNEGVEKSLDAKLDGAKKKLLSGSFVPARKLLDAFVNEVEAQGCESYDNCPKGKHLKPEAYALLKYNALYLIEHLK